MIFAERLRRVSDAIISVMANFFSQQKQYLFLNMISFVSVVQQKCLCITKVK